MLTASMLRHRMLGLLVLMFPLCDADSRCPTDLNPLILDPPEVIGKYSESVSINCSSTEEDHYGIHWRFGNTDSPMIYDKSYSIWSVSLSDWNVTAECRIKLNETHECSKDLGITVYQNPMMVTVFPTKHAAMLEGNEYELQCDVVDVAPVRNLMVRWYRNNETIRNDTFTNKVTRLVSESSTLPINISRGEDKAQFRCEAQLDFGPDGPQLPVVSDTYTVSVHYAPELMNKSEDVFVHEGDSVTLTCEAEGRPPPVFHWTDLHNTMNVSTNILNITDVTTNATYNCTAKNDLGNITKLIHVHVIKSMTPAAAPAAITTPTPSTPRGCPIVMTPAKIVVEFGGLATVNCSTSAANVSRMGWEAKVGAISTETSSVVNWMVEKVEDWTEEPLCYINLADNFQCFKKLNILLYKLPDRVSVNALDQGPMVEGTKHSLICVAINVAPVQNVKLIWHRGNETVATTVFNDTRKIPRDVSSILPVIPERDHNGALFTCVAELLLGPDESELNEFVISEPFKAVVLYKPLIKNCPGHHTGVEHELSMDTLHCEVDGNPPPNVQWYNNRNPINASEPLTRTQSGKYTAEFKNPLGNTNISISITVEYGPSFTCVDYYEVVESDTLQCGPTGLPTPVMSWFKDGEEMAPPSRWTRDDSGNYSLKATNKHGNATHELYVNVLYAPVFKQGTFKKMVTSGENLTFDCSAEGNPPPEINWSYNTSAVNVRVTTRGSQKTISFTGATSTNAGVYSCVATNKVGTVTRSVTLMMTEGQTDRGPRLSFIWWLLILLLIVLLLIVIIVACRWKKHGRYNFVPDKANDGSDIPMTPQANGQA